MAVDIPRAWEISVNVPMEEHNKECSFRQSAGAILCDCDILNKHPERLSKSFFTLGGAKLPLRHVVPHSEIRLSNGEYSPNAKEFEEDVRNALTFLYRKYQNKLSFDAMTLLSCHSAMERGVFANLGMLE